MNTYNENPSHSMTVIIQNSDQNRSMSIRLSPFILGTRLKFLDSTTLAQVKAPARIGGDCATTRLSYDSLAKAAERFSICSASDSALSFSIPFSGRFFSPDRTARS